MQKLINNFLIIFFIIVSCGGGGGGNSSPTESGGDDTADSKSVSLALSNISVLYNSAGVNPNIGSITLTATAQNFSNPYFKFTSVSGGAFSNETTFTDGNNQVYGGADNPNSDTAILNLPPLYPGATWVPGTEYYIDGNLVNANGNGFVIQDPFQFTVSVQEASGGEIVTASVNIPITKVLPSRYNNPYEVEVVTWNIKQFPNSSSTSNYVKNLLESWNADIYFLQEISSHSSLISMVNSMPDYSYVLDEESGNLGFALVYNHNYVTFNSKNELWADTPNGNDGDSDYENNAQYQFASRPPMESYVTWSNNNTPNGSKSIDLYLIGVHYKCCGDDTYDTNDPTDETSRRHHASLLLTDYILENRANDNVIVLGDFNNTGAQSRTNPTLSPFTDQDNFSSASSFKLADIGILEGSASGYSWQGWTSSYPPAHFDHIIINQPMFTYDSYSTSSVAIIATPIESGLSNTSVSNNISDHQPVMYRFSP